MIVVLVVLGIVIWAASIIIFAQIYSAYKLKDLKQTSIILKQTIEDAIKDKTIDQEEGKQIRDAVLNLEEKLEE